MWFTHRRATAMRAEAADIRHMTDRFFRHVATQFAGRLATEDSSPEELNNVVAHIDYDLVVRPRLCLTARFADRQRDRGTSFDVPPNLWPEVEARFRGHHNGIRIDLRDEYASARQRHHQARGIQQEINAVRSTMMQAGASAEIQQMLARADVMHQLNVAFDAEIRNVLMGMGESSNAYKIVRDKSMQLLNDNLTPTQRVQLEQKHFFDVVGSHSKQRYRIHSAFTNFNIAGLDSNGMPVRLLCFQPIGGLPQGDVLLTQKIYLENNELEVCGIANFTKAESSLTAAFM